MFHEPALNNPHYNDCYFAYDEGVEESLYVFVDGNSIVERVSNSESITIAETGFGTGLNLLATIRALRNAEVKNKAINFYSVECYPLSVERIEELISRFRTTIEPELTLFLEKWNEVYPSLSAGWNEFSFEIDTISININLYYGDVLHYLEEMTIVPNAWYLDGHSPDKNPDMWNETIMGMVGTRSDTGSTIATFTAAGLVKEGLRKAGFFIKRRKGFGGKRHMIIGEIDTTSPENNQEA